MGKTYKRNNEYSYKYGKCKKNEKNKRQKAKFERNNEDE